VFFEKPATSTEKAAVKALLERGFTALARVAKFSPYVAGEQFTYADIYFNFSVSPATIVCKKALDWDAYNQVPNIKALLESLVQRDSIKQAIADRAQAA